MVCDVHVSKLKLDSFVGGSRYAYRDDGICLALKTMLMPGVSI